MMVRGPVPDNHEAHCPRCGFTLISSKHHTIERTLALALAGMILFFPANLFPILSLQALGLTQSETIFSSVKAMYDNELYAVAGLVLFSVMIVPFTKLMILIYLSLALLLHKPLPLLSWAMRSYQHLDAWGMLEIYMLGILVSIIKLIDIADVTPGIGLYSLAGLIVTTLLTSTQLDQQRFWRRIEKLEHSQ